MTNIIFFISRISGIIYVLVATGIFFAIRGLVLARRLKRLAVFGLEKEAAQRQQRRSLTSILFLGLIAFFVYIISNIVDPALQADTIEPTPTPFVFVTAQPTPTQALVLFPTVTPRPAVAPADAPDEGTASVEPEPSNGCEINGTTITSPQSQEKVSGQVAVSGSANILNFLQYKFELKGPLTAEQWVVVGTFTSPVVDSFMGTFDSTSLPPGNYTLRLVVMREDGTFPTPCEVPVTIVEPSSGSGDGS